MTPENGSRPRDIRRDALLNRPYVTLVVLFGFGVAGWMPTLSFLSVFVRDELGGSILSAAFVLLAMHVVASTLGLSSGLWIRRFGSKSTYALGLTGMMVFVAALAVAPNIGWIIAVGPVAGLFLAYHWTGLQAYIIESSSERTRGMASGLVSFVMVLAPGITGPMFGALADRAGFRALGLAAFGMIGATLLLAVVLLPNLHARGAARALKGLGLRAYGGLFRHRPVAWSLLIRASTSMSFGAFTLLAGPKLVDLGGGLQSVGWFVAVGAVGGGIAQILVGRLSDAIGRRMLMVIAAVLGVVSAVVFGVADDLAILLLASSVQWFSQSAFQTLLVAVAGDIAPSGEMGRVMALQTSSFSWGMLVGVLAAGLTVSIDPALPFYITAVVMLLAIVGALKLPRRTAGRTKEGHAADEPTPAAAAGS